MGGMMMLRRMRGAALGALTLGSALITGPSAQATAAADEPRADLRKIDIVGTCQRLGPGLVYVRLICADAKVSECNARIGPERAAAGVISREEVRLDVKVGNPPYSLSVDTLNSAVFRSCENGAEVKLDKIELSNNFTVSGVQLDSCTVSVEGGTEDNAATVLGGLSCKIKTREDTMVDSNPTTCEKCSRLNADVYHYYARWSAGVVTRYLHEAQGRFIGDRGSLRVSSVVDFGV